MRGTCMPPQIIPQLLLATYLLCSSAPISGALANDTRAETEATSRALIAAQLRYDASAVARLLTNDFMYIGHDGSLATKTEFLPTAQDRSDDRSNYSNGSSCKFDSPATLRWLFI